MDLRPATAADLDAIAAILAEGFESYRDFAPPGYEPPTLEQHRDWLREGLELSNRWITVAEIDGHVVAHCVFLPASESRWGSDDPKLAHFLQLFVLRERWGSGAATALHSAALEAMAEQGYERAGLFPPTDQLRARRFYEREGWTETRAIEGEDSPLGLAVTEFRRELPARRR